MRRLTLPLVALALGAAIGLSVAWFGPSRIRYVGDRERVQAQVASHREEVQRQMELSTVATPTKWLNVRTDAEPGRVDALLHRAQIRRAIDKSKGCFEGAAAVSRSGESRRPAGDATVLCRDQQLSTNVRR